MIIKKLIISICLILINSIYAFSQVNINGKVTDLATGETLFGANLFEVKERKYAISDKDGTFNFHEEIMALADEFCQDWL